MTIVKFKQSAEDALFRLQDAILALRNNVEIKDLETLQLIDNEDNTVSSLTALCSLSDSLNEVIYILAKRKGAEHVIENSKA